MGSSTRSCIPSWEICTEISWSTSTLKCSTWEAMTSASSALRSHPRSRSTWQTMARRLAVLHTSKPTIAKYIQNGNRVIFSNVDQWNLDCVTEEWIGDKAAQCADKTPTWENMYRNSPLDILVEQGVSNARSSGAELELAGVSSSSTRDLVLGGEATLHSYATDANGLQSKVWPRVSAMAERLWSDPTSNSEINQGLTQRRLNIQRERMVTRGVMANPLQPEYCLHNEGACVNQQQYNARTALPVALTQQPQAQQVQQAQQVPAAA